MKKWIVHGSKRKPWHVVMYPGYMKICTTFNGVDAHLIAAAPDLLRACYEALNNLPEQGKSAQLIQMAIDKAEGKYK